MISAAVAQQLLGVRDAAPRISRLGIARLPLIERHHRDAGLEPRQPQRQLREDEQRGDAASSPDCRAA